MYFSGCGIHGNPFKYRFFVIFFLFNLNRRNSDTDLIHKPHSDTKLLSGVSQDPSSSRPSPETASIQVQCSA